jgi:protein-S-isoprenylcysteine O-methyltransferase Ste14
VRPGPLGDGPGVREIRTLEDIAMSHSIWSRSAILAYGVACYAAFFATFLYLVGFLAGFGVPRSIDSGGGAGGIAAERSTHVLFTVFALAVLFWAWQPLPQVVFSAESELARTVLYGVFGLGVGLVLYSTFLIDHFDLFGLRQVVLHFRGRPYAHKSFVTPSLYKHIRHPLYVGWFVTLWATPDLTVGHLLFAGVVTGYVLVAIVFEERDLEGFLGQEYRVYRERTPKFIPRLPARQPAPARATTAAS